MDDQDPRAVLGLPLDATRGDAQRAFRRLAKQTHPDAGGDAADFRAVADAWADLDAVLPPDPRPAERPIPARRPVAPPPHVLAYRAVTSQVVWAEPRPPVETVRPVRPSFAAVLQAEMARLAA